VHLWKAYVTARCAIASSTRNRTRVSDPRDTPADSSRAIDARNRCNSIFISERLRIVRTSLIFVLIFEPSSESSFKSRMDHRRPDRSSVLGNIQRILDVLSARDAKRSRRNDPAEDLIVSSRCNIRGISSPPFPSPGEGCRNRSSETCTRVFRVYGYTR